MALNVKAAMMICAACIGGMSWFLQTMQVRPVELPTPLVVSEAEPSGVAKHTVPEGDTAWAAGRTPVAQRETQARGFVRANVIDEQLELNRASEQPLALAERPRNFDMAMRPLRLPPAVYDQAEDNQVVAALDGDRVMDGGRADVAAELTPEVATSAAPEVVSGAEPDTGAMAAADNDNMDGATTDETDDAEAATFRTRRVAKGETLVGIARKEYALRDPRLVDVLIEHNPQLRKREGRVRAGEKLRLPDEATLRNALASLEQTGQRPLEETAAPRWYTIRENDSLIRIARNQLNDPGRWREILRLNESLKPNKIYPGVRIKLPPLVRVAQG